MDTCLFIQSLKDDLLPYGFDVDNSPNERSLVFRNAMVYNCAGDPLERAAQALLEDFDWTMREQLPVLPKTDDLSVFKCKKNAGPVNKSRSSEPARSNSF